MSAPDLALSIQDYLNRWPLPKIWHDIAKLRALPIRTEDGRQLSRKDWPTGCYIPIGVLESWLHGERYTTYPDALETPPLDDLDLANFDESGPGRRISGFAATTAFLARWRLGKGVYRFQPELWEAITGTDLDPAIPIDVLEYLPEWATLVETPGLTFAGEPVRGVGLHIDNLFPVRRISLLNIRLCLEGARAHTRCLLLTAPTLGECLAESERYAVRHVQNYGSQDLLPILSAALYLCARNRDIRSPEGAEFTPPTPREVVAGKKGPKAFAAGKISNWQVGWRIGAALEAATRRERQAEIPSAPTGVPRKPHIRRAHWHLYWVGKGRTEPQIKWLPPTPVNVTRITEPVVTIHPA